MSDESESLYIRNNYLLVIEWLDPAEQQTGEFIADRLTKMSPPRRVVCRKCLTAADVVAAIQEAEKSLATLGVPIIQIEAHGEPLDSDHPPRGLFGPNGQLLTWEELAGPLRSLNLASKFNLIVVMSACFGYGGLLTMASAAPAPYIALLGFTTAVGPSSLRDCLLELHRNLLRGGANLTEALDAARRELAGPDEWIRLTTPADLTEDLWLLLAEMQVGDDGEERRLRVAAQHVRSKGLVIEDLPYTTLGTMREANAQQAAESVWATVFAHDLVPENRARFPFDQAHYQRVVRQVFNPVAGDGDREVR